MNSAALDVLLVDDESLARDKMRRFLAEIAPSARVREAANGIEAVRMIEEKAPDLLFLDIQMPGMNGFDVLYHLAERRFPVIFQTAFDEFAIKAFEESACDYLLKPFSRDRFEKSFRRAEAEVLRAHADQRATPESASTIQEALPECAIYLERLCVDEKGVRIVVQVADVDSFVSRDHYTCVHVGHIEYLSPISLQQLEARLDPYAFARIHRNAMVRIASITALTRGGEPTVTLRNGQRLTVSRRSKTRLAEIVAGVSRP